MSLVITRQLHRQAELRVFQNTKIDAQSIRLCEKLHGVRMCHPHHLRDVRRSVIWSWIVQARFMLTSYSIYIRLPRTVRASSRLSRCQQLCVAERWERSLPLDIYKSAQSQTCGDAELTTDAVVASVIYLNVAMKVACESIQMLTWKSLMRQILRHAAVRRLVPRPTTVQRERHVKPLRHPADS